MESRYLLHLGDRVELTKETLLHKKGSQGIVTGKFTPSHATGCWTVTVTFETSGYRSEFCYPGSPLRRLS